MRVVVTGPTGAIGHALIEVCIENNIEVLAVCHRNSHRKDSLPRSEYVNILELDMDEYDEAACSESIKKYGTYDVFYHMAWAGTTGASRNDMDLQQKNIRFALSAVRLARSMRCATFVGIGSQAEYGRCNEKLRGDTPTFPENGYGIAKLCSGLMTRIECEKYGMKHIWVRVLSVYGPHDGENTMVMSAIRKLMSGEPAYFTKGEQEWDYLYSRDAGRALYMLAKDGRNGRTYVLGSGTSRKLRDYIDVIRSQVLPHGCVEFGKVPYAPRQVMYLCADIKALADDVGFVPEVSFEEGIAETVLWIKNNR